MTNPLVRLRPAQLADAPDVAEIWRLGWVDAHLGRVPAELVAARDEATFRTRAEQRVGDTTVAVVGAAVAGFVMTDGDEVDQVYVAAEHRGAGVAGALLAEAERRIRAAGHGMAWLAVVPDNARARRFYERHGWRDAGPFAHAAPGPDGPIPVPCHRYVKQLSRPDA
ncbi:GNAT family N-acetyltransferase [Plantactinospora sp. GCM10030261]|uniref:GNAT family N-acetyltransferase n=1 Tax=Plantactinospora sp. GCM10030261 TaxID=3273420 RepID=UPI003605FC8F